MITYIIIAIICCFVFYISLLITQIFNHKKEAFQNLKKEKSSFAILVDNKSAISQIDGKVDQKAIEKVHALLNNKKKDVKPSLIDNIRYQATYVYGLDPMKNFLLLMVKVALSLTGILFFFGFQINMAIIVALVLTLPISKILLSRLFDKKIALFLDNFVYALDIIIRGIKSGLAINDCFKQIVKDTNIVVAEQFLAINDDFKVGLSMEQVMDRFMQRMPLKEVQFFCLSLMIQNKTGGNLADIIAGLAKILRGRKTILVKIQTLSSEAKSSAIIMSCMPFALLLILSVMSPEFVAPMFDRMLGRVVLLGCVLWISIGGLIMRQMINFYK